MIAVVAIVELGVADIHGKLPTWKKPRVEARLFPGRFLTVFRKTKRIS
jgi:hypothetical protein